MSADGKQGLGRLDQDTIGKAVAVLESPSEIFSDLTRLVGLDPAKAYVGADLQRADLSGSDLAGFDFSGCDLTDARFEGATGLESLVIDDRTVLSDAFREAIRAAREEAGKGCDDVGPQALPAP